MSMCQWLQACIARCGKVVDMVVKLVFTSLIPLVTVVVNTKGCLLSPTSVARVRWAS